MKRVYTRIYAHALTRALALALALAFVLALVYVLVIVIVILNIMDRTLCYENSEKFAKQPENSRRLSKNNDFHPFFFFHTRIMSF